MDVGAAHRTVRRCHGRSVTRVVALAADLVGERSRDVDAIELEGRGEAAVEVG